MANDLKVGDYGNPIHGVSRQADTKKFAGQCREQINCRNNVTTGMSSRTGFTCMGQLIPESGGDLSNAKWETNERGDGTNFIAAYDVTKPAFFSIPTVYTEQVIARPFTFGAGAEQYYHGVSTALDDPNKKLSVSNILDTVFLSNRTVIPRGNNVSDTVVAPPKVQWLEFKTFSPGTVVEIQLSGDSTATYVFEVFDGFVTVSSAGVPDRTESERTKEYNGSYHATYFTTGSKPANSDPSSTTPAVGSSYNNWVCLQGYYGIVIKQGSESVILHENSTFKESSELPPVGFDGTVAKIIEGQGEDTNSGWYVASLKSSNTGSFGEVTWQETTAPGSTGVFNKSTMPHVIRRDIANNFTMEQYSWRDREVGAPDTNPYPSFILNGTPIQDIGVFQNRLYLVSQETVFASASDVFDDLWLESAFYNTQADPFEVFADTPLLNVMQYSNMLDGDLVLFSQNGQFVMSGEVTQTYESSAIKTVAQYEADLNADPVVSGARIFFATTYGAAAGVRDFYTDGVIDTKRSKSITDHVNDYIPGQIRQFATSTNIDTLLVLNEGDRDSMWLFEWKQEGTDDVQAAWSKWQLPAVEGFDLEFEFVDFIESELIAVVKMSDGANDSWWLWKMQWDDPKLEGFGIEFPVRLDGKFLHNTGGFSYDETLNVTYMDGLPYYTEELVAIELTGDDIGFLDKILTDGDGRHYIDNKDLRNTDFVVGIPYRQYWEAALPQIRDGNGVAIGIDAMRYVSFEFAFLNVGEIDFIASDEYGREWRSSYNNRRVNRVNNRPSNIPYGRSTWKVPIKRGADGLTLALETYSYVPFSLSSVEWAATYRPKGARV